MFCPKCRAEYREGFDVCSDCDVPLVAELPSEVESEYVDYEEVLRTFDPAAIAMIKSLLDSERITYFFQGEDFANVLAVTIPPRLLVRRDQAERAKEILKDLKSSLSD